EPNCNTSTKVCFTCNSDSDCSVTNPGGSFCKTSTHTCTAECADGKTDGTESDVDCGGTCSTKCATGKVCAANSDCSTGFCDQTTKTCSANSCNDGVKDG